MAMSRDMQQLLRWGVENTQQGDAAPPAPRQPPKPLDPGVIDAILGKTDAVRMRECLEVVDDRANPLQRRLHAWDELEMILESLDNANDLGKMGLWPPIVRHLASDEDETVTQALWVAGTAINNNPEAREAFLKQDPLATLINLLRHSTSNAETRAKSLYCLGGALKHDPTALQRFIELDGFFALEDSLRDPSLPCRRKAAFLIGTLLLDDLTSTAAREAISSTALLDLLLSSLSRSTAQPIGPDGDGEGFDNDVAESAVRALQAYHVDRLSSGQKQTFAEALRGSEGFGLAESEKKALLETL